LALVVDAMGVGAGLSPGSGVDPQPASTSVPERDKAKHLRSM
jgi:hypothetical protein